MKYCFRLLLLSTIGILAAEFAAYLLFQVFLTERLASHWRVDPESLLKSLDEAALHSYREEFYDPVLGWVFRNETRAFDYASFDKLGARVDPAPGREGRIAAYGDSFTFGEDVANNETWPHYLSELTGDRVANFGVSGYGPDQALLRLVGHLESGQVPDIIVLGVLSENIARLVNVWRAAYTKGEPLNFKPILWKYNDDVRWIAPPLRSPISIDGALRAVLAARPYDYWLEYNYHRPPLPSIPYLWSAVSTSTYLGFRAKRWQDLWEMDRPIQIFSDIIQEFVRLSEEYGFRPILLMIPMGEDFRLHEVGHPTTYAPVITKLREKYAVGLEIVDTIDQPLDVLRFYQKPLSAHTSPYGNREIAVALHKQIGEQG